MPWLMSQPCASPCLSPGGVNDGGETVMSGSVVTEAGGGGGSIMSCFEDATATSQGGGGSSGGGGGGDDPRSSGPLTMDFSYELSVHVHSRLPRTRMGENGHDAGTWQVRAKGVELYRIAISLVVPPLYSRRHLCQRHLKRASVDVTTSKDIIQLRSSV